ncbi:MAG TPA: hypothetical protein VF132_08085, partial [Rudaea sp.]
DAEPPAQLWARIEAAHGRRRRRRIGLRVGAASMFALAAVIVGVTHRAMERPRDEIDWQARAQALETQLRTLAQSERLPRAAATDATRAELLRVDLSLQAAYDRGARADELAPLWKRRSELLDALIEVREQGLALTRI